jgi:hypothetical protein
MSLGAFCWCARMARVRQVWCLDLRIPVLGTANRRQLRHCEAGKGGSQRPSCGATIRMRMREGRVVSRPYLPQHQRRARKAESGGSDGRLGKGSACRRPARDQQRRPLHRRKPHRAGPGYTLPVAADEVIDLAGHIDTRPGRRRWPLPAVSKSQHSL